MLDIEEYIKTGKLFDGRYKLVRSLSTAGGTADVWLAIDTNTIDFPLDSSESDNVDLVENDNSGMFVAIKIYRPKNALDVEGEQRFRDEYKIVYECRHANLVQPTSFSIFQETPYLVLPYCKYGSSEQLIGKKMSNDDIWKYILDVSSGLNRLHTNDPQIIHQDIKPANVLIDNAKNYAITDFGISSKRGGTHGIYFDDENSGTLAYMAPERFQNGAEPMTQSDIWAFGATLFEILTGKVPFGEEGGKAQLEHDLPIPAVSHVPADIQRLIHACLAKEPGNRPSAADIKNAALVKQYPIRSNKWLYLIFIIITFVIAILLFNKMLFSSKGEKAQINNEALFEVSLCRMNSDNIDTLKVGMEAMEELSARNYIPAIYELAFTYGWYSDSTSLKRKKMLGIDIYEDGESRFIPKIDKYNHRAVALFQQIITLNDSSYAAINAYSAYLLACYYIMPNNTFKTKESEGRKYLKISRSWAVLANDTVLLRKIEKGLQNLE